MPEVIRRQKEGVSGGPRANCRFSEGAWAAIKAAAERDGYDNPTKWVRDAAIKAAGYEAPAEEAQRPPWEVVEGEAPEVTALREAAVEGAARLEAQGGDVVAPAPVTSPKKRATPKKKARTHAAESGAGSVTSVPRATPPAVEPSLLQLAKGALRRLLT